jgi:copper chaperone CopZ
VRAFLKIEGLTDDDSAAVTRALNAVEGVVDVEVSVDDGMASVLYDIRADVATLVAAVKKAGYDARAL